MMIVQIVTGILGSGKTTTVRHLIEGPGMEHVGVVVGEYADDGFDGDMIRASGATVRQIAASGVGQGAKSYLEPTRAFVREGIKSRVIIETSGVAEIAKIVTELRQDPTIQARAIFGPTIVVMDAGAFPAHDEHFAAQLWTQIDVADVVVINKVDKAPEVSLKAIRQRIVERNDEARIQLAYMGQIHRPTALGIPYEEFIPRAMRADWEDAELADFEAFVYRSHSVCYDRVMFGHKLLNLPGAQIARFKGVLRCHDRSRCVNGLPGQLDWDSTPVDGDTRIAFIGLDLSSRREALTSLLDDELERQQRELNADRKAP